MLRLLASATLLGASLYWTILIYRPWIGYALGSSILFGASVVTTDRWRKDVGWGLTLSFAGTMFGMAWVAVCIPSVFMLQRVGEVARNGAIAFIPVVAGAALAVACFTRFDSSSLSPSETLPNE